MENMPNPIFIFHTKQKSHSNALFINPRIGFYPKEYFLWMLSKEMNRVDRTNQPLSMLLIETSYFKDLIQKTPYTHTSFNRVIETIIGILGNNFRKIDIKGWYDTDILAILMPNTPKLGASIAYNKLRDSVHEFLFQIGINTDSHFDKACGIHTYPDSLLRKNVFLEKEHKAEIVFDSKMFILNPDIFYENLSKTDGIIKIQHLIKRLMDLFGSIVGLIFLFPLMLVIGILIKLTSPGPIFFNQSRLGHHGKPFSFYKFRTMYHGANDKSHREYVTHLIQGNHEKINQGSLQDPWLKMTNDPRVTSFGKFLRRSSLDELPQLYNVLKGEMSLVGPRPPISYEVEKYKIWHLKRILEAKPGITGLWQVYGRSSTSFDDMVRLDLRYAENCSIGMDIKILFKTVKVVLSAKGAY